MIRHNPFAACPRCNSRLLSPEATPKGLWTVLTSRVTRHFSGPDVLADGRWSRQPRISAPMIPLCRSPPPLPSSSPSFHFSSTSVLFLFHIFVFFIVVFNSRLLCLLYCRFSFTSSLSSLSLFSCLSLSSFFIFYCCPYLPSLTCSLPSPCLLYFLAFSAYPFSVLLI